MSIERALAEDTVEKVRVRVLPDGRMSRDNAARYLGYEAKTLAMWALEGKGPKSLKVGGRVFYFKDTLDAFIRGDDAA
ncbi:MAG: DNA-binding protein [Rhodospirillaceae bacterium]|nr:DNA-binding protein [Rhodospirillaceae bacterium]MBT5083770.1 DNA-binding protein [Rhodospirillaceae bacterium]MBT5522995.1 DNA-binding protein [Rhodospirillaceae bacterium]MBT5879732.1 DNA-binding protein [Rhodospirillaceae bacterium]MBT7286943.1 DNA-binding protein [Rhodospirillaceae bacterium]